MKLSSPDKALLREIQRNANQSLGDLSEKVSMAQSTIWRKLQDFEASGLIRARVALLDPGKIGAKLCILASVSLRDHTEEAIDAFSHIVRLHDEIQECHKVSGAADYQLKIRVPDVEAYEHFMTHTLLRNPHIQSVHSCFVLKEIKSTTEIAI